MFIKNFKQIDKNGLSLYGGKATSLGYMIQNGFLIPGGFVVTTEAFDLYQTVAEPLRFHSSNSNLVAATTASPSSKQEFYQDLSISTLIEQIYNFFDTLNCQYVAVRSSATSEDSREFSFAGQFDTFLNVRRENLIEKVYECFDGLNSPRCIEYIAQSNLEISKIKVAVAVQAMIQSEVAGVAFTNHPVTKNKDHILIEAGYGLGEAVVSGQITPDSYLVDKNNLEIVEFEVSSQSQGLYLSTDPDKSNTWKDIPKIQQKLQKLSNNQIQKLAKTSIEIEKLYGFPCDIEWALVENQIYILQSRPITTIT